MVTRDELRDFVHSMIQRRGESADMLRARQSLLKKPLVTTKECRRPSLDAQHIKKTEAGHSSRGPH